MLTRRTILALSILVAAGAGAMVAGIHIVGASEEARAQRVSDNASAESAVTVDRGAPAPLPRLAETSPAPAQATRDDPAGSRHHPSQNSQPARVSLVSVPQERASTAVEPEPRDDEQAEDTDDPTAESDELDEMDDELEEMEEESDDSEDDPGDDAGEEDPDD